MATYDAQGNPVDDTTPTWNDVRTGDYAPDGANQTIETDDSGAPAVTVTVTPKGSNLLGLAFLAAAVYFLLTGRDS